MNVFTESVFEEAALAWPEAGGWHEVSRCTSAPSRRLGEAGWRAQGRAGSLCGMVSALAHITAADIGVGALLFVLGVLLGAWLVSRAHSRST